MEVVGPPSFVAKPVGGKLKHKYCKVFRELRVIVTINIPSIVLMLAITE